MLPSKNTKYFYNDYINNEININNRWDEFWLEAERETTNFPPVVCVLDVVSLVLTKLYNAFGSKS